MSLTRPEIKNLILEHHFAVTGQRESDTFAESVLDCWAQAGMMGEAVQCLIDHLGVKVYSPDTKCECGAFKVYGKECSKYHHAAWCPKRGL